MITIREFAEQLLEARQRQDANRDWYSIFKNKGYYYAQVRQGKWQDIHKWCQETVGEQYYAWHGEHFWFEYEKDAVLFALRWS